MKNIPEKPKKYNVSIAGISYQLVSSEPEKYVREISAIADNSVKNYMKNNSSLSVYQATVLTVVNYIDKFKKHEDYIKELENKLENISEKEKKSRENLDVLRENNFEIKKEVIRLNQLNKQLELEIAALRQQEIKQADNEDESDDSIYKDEEGNNNEIHETDHEDSGDELVKGFLEDISDPFSGQSQEQEETYQDPEMFLPLKQQSFDEI